MWSLEIRAGVALVACVAAAWTGSGPAPATAAEQPARTGRPQPVALSVVPLDLGTLGGRTSAVRAVDDSVLVGWARTTTGRRHAFAYDLAAPQPHMVDLTPGFGGLSSASDVEDGMVVGDVRTAHGSVAFAYDLRAPQPHLVLLAGLTGESFAMGVAHHVVAGEYLPSGQEGTRAFVYDLAAPSPTMVELATVAGPRTNVTAVVSTFVVGIDGPVIGGISAFRGRVRATAWTVQRTTALASTLGVAPDGVEAHEGQNVVLTVRRSEPASGTSTVRYATVRVPYPRYAGPLDVRTTRGVLTFGPGQRVRHLRIHLMRDDLTERPERIYVDLFDPTGAVLSFDSTTSIVIKAG